MLGVSLIEIMISLTIGLIIIAGIGYAYLGSKQSFRTQDALSRMQEGARIAFELMAKDIRMAGFTGCPPNTAASGDINVLSNVTVWYKNLLGQPLVGYEKTSGAWSAFPAGVTGVVGSVIAGDALTVLHADTDNSYIVSSHDAGSSQFTLTANAKIKQGAILIAAESDCSRTAIFQNSDDDDDDGDDIVIHGSSGEVPEFALGSPSGTSYPFTANSRLYPLSAVTYYIGDVNNDGEPSLFRETLDASGGNPATTAEELVEGVQDMQLLYGEDTLDAVDKVDVYRTANNVADWTRVIAIRVTLLMVSRQDEQGITTRPQKYSLDMNGDGDVTDTGETVTPNDRLLRKVFTTTIAIKNRL